MPVNNKLLYSRTYLNVAVNLLHSRSDLIMTLKRVLTYVRSTMTEKRLNNCLLLHIHKNLTDSLDLTSVAMEFINNEEGTNIFGHF